MALLAELIADGTMKLPPHVLGIMSSLANKYGFTSVHLKALSKEGLSDLANQLRSAVINNSPGDIIAIAAEGGDINGLTESGDSLMHLAARAGNCASISALNFLKADLETVNTHNATPLMEAIIYNRLSSANALIMAGANLDNLFFRRDTYLYIVAATSINKVLEVLLQKVDVDKKNHFG
ncbi:ankyrin repeat and SOCS box protein 3-like [Halyomorpha halys]|uniref:ankyrin repeat and SOCS box protein 3-like n=1 Tax=Halyomorpha halys TaxID=286706 RepID=UPI0006D4EAAF